MPNLDCRGADAEPAAGVRPPARQAAGGARPVSTPTSSGSTSSRTRPGVEPLARASTERACRAYDYIDTGTIGTDAIKVGLIYRPAVVTPVGTFQTLDSTDDPRFIDTRSRPSLAQTFEVNATGARFTVVVNHLKSKGSACTDVGDPDAGDGQGNCNGTRDAGRAGPRRLDRHRPDRQRRSRLPDHGRPQLVRDGGSDRCDQGRCGRRGRAPGTTTPT